MTYDEYELGGDEEEEEEVRSNSIVVDEEKAKEEEEIVRGGGEGDGILGETIGDWEFIEDEDGDKFWWNSESGESQWERPDLSAISVDAFLETTASPEQLELDKEYGVESSHKLVDLDKNGKPAAARFVYVDEVSCIGCTLCTVAGNTFMMEPEYGRARVFNQDGDDVDIVMEAISTCPVDCIHYVPWEDLVSLETVRDDDNRPSINFKARLVGGDGGAFIRSPGSGTNGVQIAAVPELKGDEGMRCNNCPSKGCYACPMFSIGESPIYLKRKAEAAERKRKRLEKKRKEENGASSANL